MALMEKVDNRQEQMENVRREMETLRENQSEMLEMKNAVTEMKNAFDVLISRLDVAKERISRIENMLVEIPQTETQRETGWKEKKKKTNTKNYGTITKGITHTYNFIQYLQLPGNHRRTKRERRMKKYSK